MWCDNFDADLLKFIPDLADVLAPLAGLQLSTYCHTMTDGAINHPSAWNRSDGRYESYFWTGDAPVHPPILSTRAPVRPCSWTEVARDEWVHGCIVIVNNQEIWRPPRRQFLRLMYAARGQGEMSFIDRHNVLRYVRRGLASATRRLVAACGTPGS